MNDLDARRPQPFAIDEAGRRTRASGSFGATILHVERDHELPPVTPLCGDDGPCAEASRSFGD